MLLHTEYEVRVLEINKDEVIKKLKSLNATFQWDAIQRRYVYDFIPKVDGLDLELMELNLHLQLKI